MKDQAHKFKRYPLPDPQLTQMNQFSSSHHNSQGPSRPMPAGHSGHSIPGPSGSSHTNNSSNFRPNLSNNSNINNPNPNHFNQIRHPLPYPPNPYNYGWDHYQNNHSHHGGPFVPSMNYQGSSNGWAPNGQFHYDHRIGMYGAVNGGQGYDLGQMNGYLRFGAVDGKK